MSVSVQQALDTIVSVGTVVSALTPTKIDDDLVALAAVISKTPSAVAEIEAVIADIGARDLVHATPEHLEQVKSAVSHSDRAGFAFDWGSLITTLLPTILQLIQNLTKKPAPTK